MPYVSSAEFSRLFHGIGILGSSLENLFSLFRKGLLFSGQVFSVEFTNEEDKKGQHSEVGDGKKT